MYVKNVYKFIYNYLKKSKRQDFKEHTFDGIVFCVDFGLEIVNKNFIYLDILFFKLKEAHFLLLLNQLQSLAHCKNSGNSLTAKLRDKALTRKLRSVVISTNSVCIKHLPSSEEKKFIKICCS